MGVRRRRKGQPPVEVISLDFGSLRELEMHVRDAERQERAATRFADKNIHSKQANQSLSNTVSAAVQSMRIEDG